MDCSFGTAPLNTVGTVNNFTARGKTQVLGSMNVLGDVDLEGTTVGFTATISALCTARDSTLTDVTCVSCWFYDSAIAVYSVTTWCWRNTIAHNSTFASVSLTPAAATTLFFIHCSVTVDVSTAASSLSLTGCRLHIGGDCTVDGAAASTARDRWDAHVSSWQ